jgi:hypothetical protein
LIGGARPERQTILARENPSMLWHVLHAGPSMTSGRSVEPGR